MLLLAEEAGAPDVIPQIKADLGRFDDAIFAAVAAQKAWWYLQEYTDILLDASETYLGTARTTLASFFETSATDSLKAAFALLNDLKLLLPGQRPFDLKLPGDCLSRMSSGRSISTPRPTRSAVHLADASLFLKTTCAWKSRKRVSTPMDGFF
jgi:hypothetical protein